MSNFFKKVTEQRPMVYGLSYLGLIPIFAVIYAVLPSEYLSLGDHAKDPFTYFYFSAVTITTLGYGDVLPIGSFTQVLVAIESILGITLIGLFLNALSHKHGLEVQEQEKKAQEARELSSDIKQFSAFNRLVEMHILRYQTYAIPVTSKISDRKNDELNENFSFNDMQDMFKPTLRLSDHHFTPAVNFYFAEYKELYSVIEEAIKHGYLHRWQNIETLCLEFLRHTKELDFSNYIINQPNTRLGEKKGSDFDMEMIEKHEGEVKFLRGNGINPYVAMYHQIKYSFGFIKKYRQMVSEIESG
ncbi:two pore domain potassium channel family protein [Vibrio vulnificus]|nr:two pore domain potassium channel family protein [Vibrio vulnificus]